MLEEIEEDKYENDLNTSVQNKAYSEMVRPDNSFQRATGFNQEQIQYYRPQSQGNLSDQQSDSQYNRSNQTSFNLREYNQKRLFGNTKTHKFEESSHHRVNSRAETQQDELQPNLKPRDDNFNELEEITQGDTESLNILNSEVKQGALGNVVVSLYWEEKLLMIIRFAQFYGYFMLICFEVWPYQARYTWSYFFFFLIGSFQFMVNPQQYYDTIQSVNKTAINLACYTFFIILVIFLILILLYCKIIHFRIMKKRQKFLFYKWGFWLLEILYFPIFSNLIEYSSCQYYSQKDAIQVVNCGSLSKFGRYFILACELLTFLVAILYNLMIGIHLYKEKISNTLHEEYLIKKEIEYTVGISELWNSRYLYTFSSFKGEIPKMYHRIVFNMVQFLMMIAHALMQESQTKIAITVGLLALFLFYVIATRPYRCTHSNILLLALTIPVLATSFLLLLKKADLKSALFVENYFYGLLIVVNAFCWFIIFAFIILLAIVKGKWGTNKDKIMKAIQGQDYAIFYIKRARNFKRKVLKTKKFDEKESKQLNHLLKLLTEQFNQLRDRQPIILDALLEIIESLKKMKQKQIQNQVQILYSYEENKLLYNFDFREELVGLVKSRYRIYETRDLQNQ